MGGCVCTADYSDCNDGNGCACPHFENMECGNGTCECGGGTLDCSGSCVYLGTDDNCLFCGDNCNQAFANAWGSCQGYAGCAMGQCRDGYSDCDTLSYSGCECLVECHQNHCELFQCLGGGGCSAFADDCDGDGNCECELIFHVCVDQTCCPDWSNKVCGGLCVNTEGDPNNCGGCGVVCSADHSNLSCIAGFCELISCDYNWANCDQDDVCECPHPCKPSGKCN